MPVSEWGIFPMGIVPMEPLAVRRKLGLTSKSKLCLQKSKVTMSLSCSSELAKMAETGFHFGTRTGDHDRHEERVSTSTI